MAKDDAYREALRRIEAAKESGAEILDLSNMGLTEVPPEIGGLGNLKVLYINLNQLTKIPSEISHLKELIILDLSDNQFTKVPSGITKLKNLTDLYINNNQLSKLADEFENLKNLTELHINNNLITEIPIELTKLQKLKYLGLSKNQITEMHPEITKLKNLTYLDINYNRLTTIPLQVTNLQELTYLDISKNQLTEIPSEIERLKNLERLNISYNQITHLPPELLQLNLKIAWEEIPWKIDIGINITDNPLTDPPIDIVQQGNEAIANYFAEREAHGTVELYEAKLLVVGAGNVGKTWLLHRLIDDSPPPEDVTTDGIDIHRWDLSTSRSENFRANFWDFGGQEIYHATHQFFLTKQSLYLFLWDARTDDDWLSFGYWLNTIKIFSDNSPVLVVRTKSDEKRTKEINQTNWKRRFDNIEGFHNVSAKDGSGIDDLKKAIISQLDELPHVGTKLPSNWITTREELETLPQNYIDYRDYLEICKKHKTDPERAGFLADHLHTLGIFLHFKENAILKNKIFLKPEWVTDAVYLVNDNKEVIEALGYFQEEQLPAIWSDQTLYPAEIHTELVELMKSFELCFQLPNEKAYISPELLLTEEPAEPWDETGNLVFLYKFEFMIKGLLTYLTVALHELIEDNLYWKDGLIIEREGARARIRKNGSREVEIRLNGQSPAQLLSIIRHELDRILKPFKHLQYQRLIPCICPECKSQSEPHLHSYETLQNAIAKKVAEVQCQKSFDNVAIQELLEGIGEFVPRQSGDENFSNRKFEGNYRLKIFIASGSDTADERKELELLLKGKFYNLESRNITLEPILWENQRHSFHGERIQDYFNEKLAECSVAICLFRSRVGEYSKEELDFAWNNYQEGKKPRYLYVYFCDEKLTPEEAANYHEVDALKKEIQKKEQIYGNYDSIDNLKLKIRDQLEIIALEITGRE